MYRNDKCRRCDALCGSSPTKCGLCDLACYCSPKCQADDKWRHEVDCQVAKVLRECSGCGEERSDAKRCGSCLDVWYCSAKCQKRHWPQHKPHCKIISQETIKVSEDILARIGRVQQEYLSSGVPTYYWGNTPAVDLINLSLNEGSSYASPLALLLCGVGDPRNVALSLASLPESYQEHVTFVLNDISPCTLARTVLLLYMLFERGQEEATTVTQVWYSICISDKDHSFLTRALEQLVRAASLEELTDGLMAIPDEHFQTLKRVWTKWLHPDPGDLSRISPDRLERITTDDGAKDGTPFYLSAIPSQHRRSAEQWFKDGLLRQGVRRENVTLTGCWNPSAEDPFRYCIMPDALPFTSWDYKEAKAFHNVPSLQEMYSEYVSHVLAKCASRLTNGQVKLHCLLSDCLKIQPFLPEGLSFDRITTSNLCDFIILPTLLDMCRGIMNRANPCSVVITESCNWSYSFQPEIQVKMTMDFMLGIPQTRALKDTGDKKIANSNARTAYVEYFDMSTEFEKFLRACLLLADAERFNGKSVLPSLHALALEHGLVLRDYRRNQNRIIPYRWPINCRRVTQLTGFDRTVEWVLPANH